jgi:hypothetical protein
MVIEPVIAFYTNHFFSETTKGMLILIISKMELNITKHYGSVLLEMSDTVDCQSHHHYLKCLLRHPCRGVP